MGSRKSNGEGSIYRRSDGRWVGTAFVDTTSGRRKRIYVYAGTRREAHDNLADKLTTARKGIRTPDTAWTVGAYLNYWLESVVGAKNRPRTTELYAATVHNYLQPGLGAYRLASLTIPQVQRFLNEHLAEGRSVRTVHLMRSVLRAALGRAEREELVARNVAKLVDLPAWERKLVRPWTADEAAKFLAASRSHRLFPAFAMLLLYGMRRGEVLGLRWCDVVFPDAQLQIRQQLQRVGGRLETGPVKTAAGRRDLPLIAVVREALARLYVDQHREVAPVGSGTHRTEGDESLVFRSTAGTPIDPKNFVRSFHEVRQAAGLPRITVHHTRHTAATLLKNLGVPVRDAQLILGHAQVTTTQQLYQHADVDGQARALAQMEWQLMTAGAAVNSDVNVQLSTGEGTNFVPLTSGGPRGARTLDTLLKSLKLAIESTGSTSVIAHLRARAYAQIVGGVAVKMCCQSTGARSRDATTWSTLLRALRQTEIFILRERSFPMNLLPSTHRCPK